MSWFTGSDEALEKAIDVDSPVAVQSAIKAGANVNAKGKLGVSLLEYAIGHNSKRCFQELLRLGADPEQRDDEGDNAVTLAAIAFSKDRDYLILAIKAGGDPNTRRPDRDPILVRFINDRNIEAIRMMKELGADLDLRSRTDSPLLIDAGTIEYWDVVWTMLELGAKYDYKNEPFGWPEVFNKPKVTPPDSPLWPFKVKSWKFLKDHGVAVPDLS